MKNKKKGFLFQLSRLFSRVADLVVQRVKIEATEEKRRSAEVVDKEELCERAKEIAEHLGQLKKDLFKEFGGISYAFVAKTVDPIIEQALFLIENVKKEGFKASALYSARLYSQFTDEEKLERKIIGDGIAQTRHVINKDCEVLEHYIHHLLQEEGIGDEEIAKVAKEELEEIFRAFYQLSLQKAEISTLKDLFLWRAVIDEKRTELSEKGFHAIDSFISRHKGEELVLPSNDQVYEEPIEADWAS